MSTAARIEELQRKFDENPRRYFAPLANECRKAGDLEAAIAICRTHLPQQPGHMSGHIVYGQALYEAGELAEAKTVFETALTLDPENLIALRHLGDIAARTGDPDGARSWYSRVLETDPRNEEIQALVAALPPAGRAAAGADVVPEPTPVEPTIEGLPTELDPALVDAAADAAEPAAPVEPEPVHPEPLDALDFELPGATGGAAAPPPAPAAPEIAPGAATADAANRDELLDLDSGFTIGPTLTTEAEAAEGVNAQREAGLEPTAFEFEPPSLDSAAAGLEGLETSTFEPPPPSVRNSVSISEEALLDQLPHDVPHPIDFEATGFGATGLEPTGIAPPSADETLAAPSFEHEPPDAGPLQDPPAIAAGDQAVGDDSGAGAAPADAFVTETMAELYLQQGYRDRALDVYRQLIAQHPDDAGLRERMARVEAEGSAVVSDGFATEDVETGGAEYEPASAGAEGAAPAEVLPGLPAALEPALVDAAADATEAAPAAAAGTGITIRQFLSALATGAPMAIPAASAPMVAGEPAIAPTDAYEPPVPPAPAGLADEPAAVAMTAVAAPRGEEGGGLDGLFGAPSPEDVRSADRLAAAFAPPPPAVTPSASLPAADPLSGRPARPAGSDLSLDHVFGAPRQHGGNASSARNTGGFSFDQFFAEGAVRPARDDGAPEAAPAAGEDDIEQFNSWLQGLKKQ